LGNNPSELLAPLDDQHDQIKAFELANNRWADRMTTWMKDGAAAIAQAQGGGSVTLRDNHVASLSSLSERLGKIKQGDEAQRRVCCNLLLDAFTWHKGDVDRVIDTLHTDAFQWWWDTDKRTTLENYTNPYTDEQLRSLADLKVLELPAKAGK